MPAHLAAAHGNSFTLQTIMRAGIVSNLVAVIEIDNQEVANHNIIAPLIFPMEIL